MSVIPAADSQVRATFTEARRRIRELRDRIGKGGIHA
jgi:hypothetical protein